MNLRLPVSFETWLEAENITNRTYFPLNGFLNQTDYHSVINSCQLTNGMPWTLPITLDIPEELTAKANKCRTLILAHDHQDVAEVQVKDIYKVQYDHDLPKLFRTSDLSHPGIKKEVSRSPFRVGGAVTLLKKTPKEFPDFDLEPWQVRECIADQNFKTIAGFQTRNPLHRAHEHLQRIALEICDGLLIQPLIGWKKKGDFTPQAVMKAYQKMITEFYPKNRVILATLRIPMRYAGPREAVMHALIRRNFGCTHFIVGRDHAGVGDFYGKYEAQQFACEFSNLGITILPLCGPYYCHRCATIVTEKNCAHTAPDILPISGTYIRNLLSEGKLPPKELMRSEIATTLIELQRNHSLFIEETQQ